MSQYTKVRETIPVTLKESLGSLYKYIKPNLVILDVGCSSGYFGQMLIKEKKATVDGVEYNSEDAKQAQKVLRNVYSFDLDGSDWPKELLENKYDLIFFGDVLEHLKDPGTVLKKFSKLLSKSGKVIISIPNIAHGSIRLELLSGSFEYEELGILDNTHLKYFTFNSFVRLLAESGYKVLATDQITIPMSKDTIDTYINNLGLRTTDKFYTIMHSAEATAFQYKFLAELGKPSKSVLRPKKPKEISHAYMVEINKLSTDNIELKEKEKELESIKNSTSWKVTKPMRDVKGYFVKRKKA